MLEVLKYMGILILSCLIIGIPIVILVIIVRETLFKAIVKVWNDALDSHPKEMEVILKTFVCIVFVLMIYGAYRILMRE